MKGNRFYLLLFVFSLFIFFNTSASYGSYGYSTTHGVKPRFIYKNKRWTDSSIPVKYWINPGEVPSQAKTLFIDGIKKACETWNQIPHSRFRLVYQSITDRKVDPDDGYNIWCYNPGEGSLPDVGAHTFAKKKIVGGVGYGITDCDVEFYGKNIDWSNSCLEYFESVAIHELGHWIDLVLRPRSFATSSGSSSFHAA